MVFSGFTGLLGYLFGTPLLYGGDIIPVAATTNVAFLFLGTGVVVAAGPGFYPLNLFFGHSTRTRLTRIFLPLVLLLILAQAIVYEIFAKVFPLPLPLVAALNVLIFIIITIVAVERASTSIGEVLTQVMDNQEEEITKRTIDLLIITNKLQTLLQASPLAIISLDLEGRVRSWNHAAENLFGWTEAEVMGKPLPTVPEEEQEQFHHSLRQIKEDEGSLRAEIRRRRKDGAIIQISLSTAPVRDAIGQIIGVIGILEDITLLKQAQEALRQSQKQMHLLLESTEHGFYGIDPDGGCTFINRAALEMLQYSRAELIGRQLHNLIHHTRADGTPYPEAECPVNQVLSSGIGAQLDGEILWRRDGSMFPVQYSSYPLQSDGRILGAVVTFSDITARKQAEEALRESEERFRTLVELAPDIIYRLDETGRILFISPAVAQLGYQAEDLLGKKLVEIVYSEDRPQVPHAFVERRIGDRAMKNLEIRLTAKDGQPRDYSLSLLTFSFCSRGVWNIPDDQIKAPGKKFLWTQGIARDISGLKSTQVELETSERRLQAILDTTVDAIITIDTEGIVQSFNRAAERLFGYAAAEVVGQNVKMLMPSPYRDNHDSSVQHYLQTGERRIIGIGRGVAAQRRDGTVFPIELAVSEVWVEEERFFTGIIRDITESKRAEELLAWQTRVDASLVQLSAELLVEPSVEEISALVLKEAQQLTDSPNGFVGYLDPQTGNLVCPTLTRDILEGCQTQDGEIIFKDFRGLWGWVLNQRRPLLTNTPESDPRSMGVPQGHVPISRFVSAPALLGNELVGQVALANAPRDYTDQDLTVVKRLSNLFALAIQRHRTEMELEETRDAAEAANRAKSDFLSSMSHELRTPMNAIIGFSEILQDQHFGSLNEKQARQINHILTSGRHLLSLINDILDLSKVESGKMTLELTTVAVADLLQNSLVMIKEKALKHQLHLETDLAPELADLRMAADERKLKQIMFNLLANAAKYTPDGGEIKVTAKREAENLVVSVADTGIGIALEDQERTFEAFEQVDSSYTRQQEGTGLGLALTRRMVEIHGGRIWVKSAGKDQGSTFIFIIPLRPDGERETLPKSRD